MTLQDFQVSDRDLSDAALREYLESAAIAVDTETMGLLPQRDRLCLVQLCNLEGKVTAIRIAKGQGHAPNLKKTLGSGECYKSVSLCSL
jgi:ribonuclease D